VKLLVNLGANVNNRDKLNNQTALFYASREGHLETLNYLIEKGADPFILDNKR
jgi:ankyrin repeat protein